jgi:hypothetical protein
MEERNGLTNELIDKLKAQINQYKQREDGLPKPEQIPNEDPIIKNQIHGGHCQQRRGSRPKRSCLRQNGMITKYQPVFAREQLIAGESCEVEIVDYNNGWFLIGVATAELRNRAISTITTTVCAYMHTTAHSIPTANNKNTISNSKPATESQFAAHNNKLNGCAAHNCCALRPFRTDSETHRSSPFCGFAVKNGRINIETAVCVMNE